MPFIAETGGLNAMIVDSTALPEQVVRDVLASAFGSAGQRCSALRLLCVQEDIADRVLRDAGGRDGRARMSAIPALLATDVGPVIDAEAQAAAASTTSRACARKGLRDATARCRAPGGPLRAAASSRSRRSPSCSEVFGPVLHVRALSARARSSGGATRSTPPATA